MKKIIGRVLPFVVAVCLLATMVAVAITSASATDYKHFELYTQTTYTSTNKYFVKNDNYYSDNKLYKVSTSKSIGGEEFLYCGDKVCMSPFVYNTVYEWYDSDGTTVLKQYSYQNVSIGQYNTTNGKFWFADNGRMWQPVSSSGYEAFRELPTTNQSDDGIVNFTLRNIVVYSKNAPDGSNTAGDQIISEPLFEAPVAATYTSANEVLSLINQIPDLKDIKSSDSATIAAARAAYDALLCNTTGDVKLSTANTLIISKGALDYLEKAEDALANPGKYASSVSSVVSTSSTSTTSTASTASTASTTSTSSASTASKDDNVVDPNYTYPAKNVYLTYTKDSYPYFAIPEGEHLYVGDSIQISKDGLGGVDEFAGFTINGTGTKLVNVALIKEDVLQQLRNKTFDWNNAWTAGISIGTTGKFSWQPKWAARLNEPGTVYLWKIENGIFNEKDHILCKLTIEETPVNASQNKSLTTSGSGSYKYEPKTVNFSFDKDGTSGNYFKMDDGSSQHIYLGDKISINNSANLWDVKFTANDGTTLTIRNIVDNGEGKETLAVFGKSSVQAVSGPQTTVKTGTFTLYDLNTKKAFMTFTVEPTPTSASQDKSIRPNSGTGSGSGSNPATGDGFSTLAIVAVFVAAAAGFVITTKKARA